MADRNAQAQRLWFAWGIVAGMHLMLLILNVVRWFRG